MIRTDWIAPMRLAHALLDVRNRHLALIDLLLLPMAAVMAFVMRFDPVPMLMYLPSILAYALAAPLIKIPIFRLLGLYQRFWQYASADEAAALGWTVLTACVVQGAIFLGILVPLAVLPPIPRSIPLIDILMTLVCVAGPRFALRVGVQRARRWAKNKGVDAPARHVLIAGAGEAGALVLREMESNPQTGLVPIGLVDDDPNKQGVYIHHHQVLGTLRAIPNLVREYRVDQVVIAMPSAPGSVVRTVVGLCEQAGVTVRIVPGMYELLSGSVGLQQIRSVQIEDLLRRELVKTDNEQVAALLCGRRVLVTGAGGSIGSELCRQIVRCQPAELVLLGHGENSIFEIYNELKAGGWKAEAGRQRPEDGDVGVTAQSGCGLRSPTSIIPVIADVRFPERIGVVFDRYRPEIVFHAAAHKHVPLMESNVEDAITNNVMGTRHVVEASMAAGVTHFVLISTDKAVNPTSMMGATKRVAEQIVQQAARQTKRCFVAVRFGNVLGSRGSVVPFFQKQIAAGGPVTVTHPEVKRYFMTIPEAVQLVLQAAALGKGGEVFVLDMGEPVRILDLAQDLIRLSGLEPGVDVEIQFTGLRPGEKLFEELFLAGEAYEHTVHRKIFVYRNGTESKDQGGRSSILQEMPVVKLDASQLMHQVDNLVMAARQGDQEAVKRHMRGLVPEYQPEIDTNCEP